MYLFERVMNKLSGTLEVSLLDYFKKSTTYRYDDGVPIFIGDIVKNQYGVKAEVLFGKHLNKRLGYNVNDLYFRGIDEKGNYTESYDLYSFCTGISAKSEICAYIEGNYRTSVNVVLQGVTLEGNVEHSNFRIRLANLIRDIIKPKNIKNFRLTQSHFDKLVRLFIFDGDLSAYTFNYYQLKVKEPILDYLIKSRVIKVVYGVSPYKYPEYSLITWDNPEHIDRIEYYDTECDEMYIIEDKESLDRVREMDVVKYYVRV